MTILSLLATQAPKIRHTDLIRHMRITPLFRKNCSSMEDPQTQFLKIKCEEKETVQEIAYVKVSGLRNPGIVYIPGYMLDKSGSQATSLQKFCQKYDFPYVRYDPSGMGESKGAKLNEVTLLDWIRDAGEVLLRLTDGPQMVVVFSTGGGWIAPLLAEKYPEKIKSILMISPAVNFNHRFENMLRSQLDEKSLERYEEGEVVRLHHPRFGALPLRKATFEALAKVEFSLETNSLDVNCPVRIIHGMKDKDAPFMESLSLQKALKTTDLHLLYLKDGDHWLSSEEKMEIIYDKVLELAAYP